jgi:hypothetical protein
VKRSVISSERGRQLQPSVLRNILETEKGVMQFLSEHNRKTNKALEEL